MQKRLRVPFFGTTPVEDIRNTVLLIPLFWILGLAQMIWPLLAGIFWTKTYLSGARTEAHPIMKLSFFFLLAFLFSGLFIVELPRYFTFFRDFSVFLSATIWLWYTINGIKQEQQLDSVISAVSVFGLIASVVGLLAYFHLISINMLSPIGYLMPSAARGYDYVANLLNLTLLGEDEGEFFGLKLIRIKSFFYDPTNAAGAYCILIPLQYYWARSILKGVKKTAGWLALGVSLLTLYLMNSRTAVLALFGGIFLVCLWFLLNARGVKRLLFWFIVAIAGCLFLIYLPSIFRLAQEVSDFIINLRYPTDRIFIAKLAYQGWLERFFFGWGTQRDYSATYSFPIGSHGAVLGMLYKHGIIGFILFSAIFVQVGIEMVKARRLGEGHPKLQRCIYSLGVALIATMVANFTMDIELDAIRLHFVWLVFGLIICTGKILKHSQANDLRPICNLLS